MSKKLATLVIVYAALVSSVFAQQTNQGPTTWALVVGVSKYQKLPGGQQLQFADRDAALFAETIQKRGVNAQNVRMLTGVEATASAIKSAVGNWLAKSVSEQDTVLIFFSGHGFFEREFGESYLLGYDSDPKDPYGTALSISELGQVLVKRVRSARVLVVADAVRRDLFDPESDPGASKSFAQSFDQITASRPGVYALIASAPGEFSREGQRWGGHGVFARHLADVLFDGADKRGDLAVAADDLFALLKDRIAADTSGKQHPWRSGGVSQTDVARVDRRSPQPIASNVLPKSAAPELPKASEEKRSVETPSQVRGQRSEVRDQTSEVRRQPEPKTVQQAPSESTSARVRPTNQSTKSEVRNQTAEVRPQPEPPTVKQVPSESTSARVRPTNESTSASRAAEKTSSETKPTSVPAIVIDSPAERSPSSNAETKSASNNPSPRLSPNRTAPPGPATIRTTPAENTPPRELASANVKVGEIGIPPKPANNPPGAVVVSPDRATSEPETVTATVVSSRAEAAPSPLVLQLEAAIAARTLIEPKSTSAWDLYQRMMVEPGAAQDAARLKPLLVEALVAQGRSIVSGDVRSDNISDKVDDFKRAGQMLARARTLSPESADISTLEKLSAAQALISLQFYDEAERALSPLQTSKLAAVENALGLVFQGKLDTWRAERAFKRAVDLDAKWAIPHYNLALLYRSQQNQTALSEFEAAAANDQNNVSLLTALGDEYFSRQQFKESADTFRKAIALKSSDDNLHTKLGHALYSQGLQNEANREYQKAQELRRRQP